MATYYVRKTGNDANAGTSPGAAWLTIGKAAGASGIANTAIPNDVWIGGGVYRETITALMTNPTAEQRFLADVTGAQTGDAGQVTLTAYTTNDTTAPSANAALKPNGKNYLTFIDINIVGGNAAYSCLDLSVAPSLNCTFTRCLLTPYSNNYPVGVVVGANAPLSLLFDSCLFGGMSVYAFLVVAATSGSADYDIGLVIKNCKLRGYATCFIYLTTSGALAFKPGGCNLWNCDLQGMAYGVLTAAGWATSIPCTAYNNSFVGANGLYASVAGQIVAAYNDYHCATPRTNVTAGTGDQTVYPPLLEWGQSELRGGAVFPHGMPAAGSVQLGFGAQAGGPSVDMLGYARPTSGQSVNSVGALERETIGGSGLILATRRVYPISRPRERPRRPPTILTMAAPVLSRPLRVY